MSLMQEILTRIEQEAAKDSQRALQCAGLIAEAEVLRDTLRQHGVENVNPIFLGHGDIVFSFGMTGDAMRIRRAIAKAGLEIEAERVCMYGNNIEILIKGLLCKIFVPLDHPMAKAA